MEQRSPSGPKDFGSQSKGPWLMGGRRVPPSASPTAAQRAAGAPQLGRNRNKKREVQHARALGKSELSYFCRGNDSPRRVPCRSRPRQQPGSNCKSLQGKQSQESRFLLPSLSLKPRSKPWGLGPGRSAFAPLTSPMSQGLGELWDRRQRELQRGSDQGMATKALL